jgi:hypothetical protein
MTTHQPRRAIVAATEGGIISRSEISDSQIVLPLRVAAIGGGEALADGRATTLAQDQHFDRKIDKANLGARPT